MKHKVLLYGEYWEGTHIDCISKVLELEHIEYKIFDFYSIISPIHNPNFFDKIKRKLKYNANEKLINHLLIKEIDIFKPTILLVSKGINIYPETFLIFKKSGIIISNWNPDDFFNNKNTSKHLLNSLNLFDFVFSARKHLFHEYVLNGISNPHYIEWYYIPWLHKLPNNNFKVEDKISFIGTYSKRREHILASIDNSVPIEVWGSGWNNSKIVLKNNISLKKKILNQSDFPKYISKSKINLNILTTENRDQTNLKLFEITASSGLLLTESTNVTNEIFKDSCFYYDYNNINSLNNTIQYILNLKNFNYVEQVKQKGVEVTYNNKHSINDRVKEILNIFDK